MSERDDADRPLAERVRERAVEIGRATLLGGVLAALGVIALVATGETLLAASETVFALGALVLGFAVLGWSGSIFMGRGLENLQEYTGTDTDWTEADSRRAMSVLMGVGGGAMVGASLATIILDGLL